MTRQRPTQLQPLSWTKVENHTCISATSWAGEYTIWWSNHHKEEYVCWFNRNYLAMFDTLEQAIEHATSHHHKAWRGFTIIDLPGPSHAQN